MYISKWFRNHKGLVRGVVSYSFIWPASSIAQEYIEYGKPWSKIDWKRAARFGVFGTLCMAPMVYYWQTFSNAFFPRKNFGTAVKRAIIEQIAFTPIGLASFFFGMSLLENKTIQASKAEVGAKLWPTYRKAIIYWPIVQSINFYIIPEKNRVVYVSAASFVWTMIMAHIKTDNTKDLYHIDNKKVR